MKELARKSKDFRESVLKKTQKEVADIVGVSSQTVSNFESGRNMSFFVFNYYLEQGMKVYADTDSIVV